MKSDIWYVFWVIDNVYEWFMDVMIYKLFLVVVGFVIVG